MATSAKSKWIIGNWKMHKTQAEAKEFIKEIGIAAAHSPDIVALAVPFTCLGIEAYGLDRQILIGAQNLYFEKEGAYTGEISAAMLVSAGAKFVLVGHSERRTLFEEGDSLINKKVKSALEAGLKVVLCVGENQVERSEGRFEARLTKQLIEGLKEIDRKFTENLLIAYEPIWAIGTGVPATPAVAETCHVFCRKILSDLYGDAAAGKIPILYGGSVTPANAKEFLAQNEINGLLVGKASLSSELFVKIIDYA